MKNQLVLLMQAMSDRDHNEDSDAESDGFAEGDLSWEAIMAQIQVMLLSSLH